MQTKQIYETQAEYESRMESERRFEFKKQRSRNKARNVGIRRECRVRADFRCEICLFSFDLILNIHHIMPVHMGGSASISNLIVLCPNCHGLIHHYSHSRSAKELFYPAWTAKLIEIGLSEYQAQRLIRVASKDVRILEDGSFIDYQPQK